MHPTHGFLFETWTNQNAAMLRLLASRGVVVISPVRVGAPLGVGPAAPIVGGLMPGRAGGLGAGFPRTEADCVSQCS